MDLVITDTRWATFFGKRYLSLDHFSEYCQLLGLYNCTRLELELYERQGWMYPAARLEMPEEYARAFWQHQLADIDEAYLPHHELEMSIRYPTQPSGDSDLCHPIDKAWGTIASLKQPSSNTFRPWDDYSLAIGELHVKTASHFYHYWQVYELYQVRKQQNQLCRDYAPVLPVSLLELLQFFDALSYFQHLYRAYLKQLVAGSPANDDGYVAFDHAQQRAIEAAAKNYASDTLHRYHLNEDDSYKGLKGMLGLHFNYQQAERYKLAEMLKLDIWRMVELISFAFGASTDDIAHRVGFVGLGVSQQNSLEQLFPNKRKSTRGKAEKILDSFAREFNKSVTGSYQISHEDVRHLLDFVEKTDLALFEYVLVELNTDYFERTSWFVAQSFLRLKSLASFPESLMRTLIERGGDTTLQTALAKPGVGMGKINELLFAQSYPNVWSEYEKAIPRQANNATEFQTNSGSMIARLASAMGEDQFLGVWLSLATLIRNFTSHHLVEDSTLLNGRYVHCVRGVLSASFFVWRHGQKKGWV